MVLSRRLWLAMQTCYSQPLQEGPQLAVQNGCAGNRRCMTVSIGIQFFNSILSLQLVVYAGKVLPAGS